MKIFRLRKTSRAVRSSYKLNLDMPIINQVSFGDKSLRYYGLKIWNLKAFKNIMKNWNGVSCKYKVCQYH